MRSLTRGTRGQTSAEYLGALLLVVASWFASILPRLREQVRPIYVERGILPPATEALRTTTQLTMPTD